MPNGNSWVNTWEIKRRMKAAFGRRVLVQSEFAGWRNRMHFYCVPCKRVWDARPQNAVANGCPLCTQKRRARNVLAAMTATFVARHRKRIRDVCRATKIRWINPDIESIKITDTRRSLRFIHPACGYEWSTTPRAVLGGAGCPSCANKVRLAKSLASNALVIRSHQFTNEEYDAYVDRFTQGRSRLVGDWQGGSYTRQIGCNLCNAMWTVPGGRDVKTGLLCKACTRRGDHSGMAIAWLEAESKRRRIKIQHARNGGEFRIPGTNFKVDGYNARTRTVFEFHGDAWHGNPNRYRPRFQPHPFSNKPANVLYRETIQREAHIRALGYTVVVMWESDWVAQRAGGGDKRG